MTKEEFKAAWEANAEGSGITYNDIADCAEIWGITAKARIQPMEQVQYLVLKAAGVSDAEDYKPEVTA